MERIVDWPITSKTSCHVFIRSILSGLQTFSFDQPTHPPSCIYQSDLAALYVILVEKILREEKIPKGGKGYYFAIPSFFSGWGVREMTQPSPSELILQGRYGPF